MSIELNKESVEQADASSCQGTNCGTTTGDHSSECLAEAAAGQGWELKPGDLCGRDCPIHKILAEQAGGDEHVSLRGAANLAFNALHECVPAGGAEKQYSDAIRALETALRDIAYSVNRTATPQQFSDHLQREARAALAQPSPKCATCGGTGMVDDGEITCSEGGIPYENGPVKCVKDCPDCKAQPSPAPAEAERPEVVAYLFVKPDGTLSMDAVRHKPSQPAVAVMTVAQHERIVGELRADRDSWAEQAEQRLADWDEMRKERDAALTRVEQQERTIAGMNEAHATLAGLYEAAQAQHSVPDVSGCRRNRSALTDAQMRRLYENSTETENERLGFEAFARLIRRAEAVHQITAAPGKEGV
ncbi:TPA: hypothetical protein ACHTL7_005182 [Pseudomonas aeruginosa]